MSEIKSQMLFNKINILLKNIQKNNISYLLINNFLHPKTKQVVEYSTPIWRGDAKHICLDIFEGSGRYITTLSKDEIYDIETLESICNALKVTDEKIQLFRKNLNELYNTIGGINEFNLSLLECMIRFDKNSLK